MCHQNQRHKNLKLIENGKNNKISAKHLYKDK